MPQTLDSEIATAQALLQEQLRAERIQKAQRILHSVQEGRRQMEKSLQMSQGGIRGAWQSIELAREHRRALKEGHFYVFFLPFSLAIAQDTLSIIAMIPFVGPLITFIPSGCITIYLIIFLWGRGTFMTKMGGRYLKKLARTGMLTIEWLIPIINLFPLATFVVWLAYRDAKKAYRTAKSAEEKTVEMIA